MNVRWNPPVDTDEITSSRIMLDNGRSMLILSYIVGIQLYLPDSVGHMVFIQSESEHLPSEIVNATIVHIKNKSGTTNAIIGSNFCLSRLKCIILLTSVANRLPTMRSLLPTHFTTIYNVMLWHVSY